MKAIARPVTKISLSAEQLSFTASIITLLLLASLHILSPEFDPSWRMVSEYANGHYGWVLSLLFLAWAVSSWTLAIALWSQIQTRAGKVGLIFLIAAGLGEAMASIFDINHPLHGLAGLIGVGSLPIAAILISKSLSRAQGWSSARGILLWTANLTWISVLLLLVTFAIMITTYTLSGATVNPQVEVTVLPAGVIGLVGWANRFLIVTYCVWAMTIAWQELKLGKQES